MQGARVGGPSPRAPGYEPSATLRRGSVARVADTVSLVAAKRPWKEPVSTAPRRRARRTTSRAQFCATAGLLMLLLLARYSTHAAATRREAALTAAALLCKKRKLANFTMYFYIFLLSKRKGRGRVGVELFMARGMPLLVLR